MTLTNQDRAECREIAREIVKEVLDEYNETHIATCPYGRSLLKLTFISIGIALGGGLTSGGIIVGISRLLGVI